MPSWFPDSPCRNRRGKRLRCCHYFCPQPLRAFLRGLRCGRLALDMRENVLRPCDRCLLIIGAEIMKRCIALASCHCIPFERSDLRPGICLLQVNARSKALTVHLSKQHRRAWTARVGRLLGVRLREREIRSHAVDADVDLPEAQLGCNVVLRSSLLVEINSFRRIARPVPAEFGHMAEPILRDGIVLIRELGELSDRGFIVAFAERLLSVL